MRLSDTGKLVTVVYTEVARFSHQRAMLRVASSAAMFYKSKKLDDPPSGRFWTLLQDGNVMPLVPPATGFGWSDGRNRPVLDEGDSLDPGDNVGDPLLDAWVECVQWNSAGDRHKESPNAASELVHSPWAGWLASGPRTFLWCCEFCERACVAPFGEPSQIRATQWGYS